MGSTYNGDRIVYEDVSIFSLFGYGSLDSYDSASNVIDDSLDINVLFNNLYICDITSRIKNSFTMVINWKKWHQL